MRLDLNFLWNLLLKIDSFGTFEPITNYNLIDDDTPINKVNAYLDILGDEDLIEVVEYESDATYKIKYITIKGQALIDKVKTQSAFQRYIENMADENIYSLNRIIESIITM